MSAFVFLPLIGGSLADLTAQAVNSAATGERDSKGALRLEQNISAGKQKEIRIKTSKLAQLLVGRLAPAAPTSLHK